MTPPTVNWPNVSSRLTWAKANLFDTRRNSVISLAAIGLGGYVGFLVLKFVLFQANWGLVALNRKLFFIGSYPPEEIFRIWITVFIVALLVGLSYGIWIRKLAPLPGDHRRGGGDSAHIWAGERSAHSGAGIHRGDTIRGPGHRGKRHRERAGGGVRWSSPLAAFFVIGAVGALRQLMAAACRALWRLDGCGLGRQATVPVEKQSGIASGHRGRVGPAHTSHRPATAGSSQQPTGRARS